MSRSLIENFDWFEAVFGNRNAFIVGGPRERAQHLRTALVELQRCWRRGQTKEAEECLGSVFGWVGSLLNALPVPWLQAMAKKYAGIVCCYCGHQPCGCQGHRPDPQFFATPEEIRAALGWDIERWITRLDGKYGHKNRPLGVENAAMRLSEEITELMVLVEGPDNLKPSELRQELAKEAGDMVTWVLTLAYVAEMPLEQILERRYGDGCPICHLPVCDCPRFVMVDGRLCHHGSNVSAVPVST